MEHHRVAVLRRRGGYGSQKMNPSKKPLDVIGRQRDLRACGHSDDFKLLKGEPPANVLRRKEKWEAKRCPACVAAADKLRKEESAKLRAEREQKFRLPTG